MGNPVGQYGIPVNGCGGIAYLGGDDYLILQDHDGTEWGQTTFAGVVVGLGGFVMSDPSVRQLRVQLHVG